MALTPQCPDCRHAVPFGKTQWGLGQPFPCPNCGRGLVIEKNYWIPLTGFVAFWLLKGYMTTTAATIGLLLAILAGIWIASMIFMPAVRSDQ